MTQNTFKPTVLQIVPELGPGGAEQGCIDVAAALAESGVRSLVASHGGERVHELARLGAEHIDLPVHSKNPLVMLRNARRLEALIRQYEIDIVHVRSRAPAWSAYRACRSYNRRTKSKRTHFMTTCHAPYNVTGKWKRRYNSIMAKGERVIAISHYVADYLKRHYEISDAVIRIIHRGIPMDKFHPTMVQPQRMVTLSEEWRLPEGANIVLFPHRLTRWKGHHVLIDALKRINRPDLFCVIVGSDQGRTAYRQELEAYIQQAGLGSKVRMVDHCPDMPAAYMLATVVVSASTDPEGFGRVPVEAQAMGRPIIATDHGGAKETVIPGQTGWLVSPGKPNELAKALDEALSLSPDQRVTLANRAMAHIATHFTRDIMTDKTLDVYADLLRGDAHNHAQAIESSQAEPPDHIHRTVAVS